MILKEKVYKMSNQFTRTEILIGKDGIEKLQKAKVAIFGIGGVGSFVVEALVRSGIGSITLVDNDVIDITNINRQIHSNMNNIGKAKVDEMKKRILEINPDLNVETYNPKEIDFDEEDIIDESYDYVVDAVDTVKTKLKLIEKSTNLGVPIISCMGAGNKLDATKFEVTDIYKTTNDPLAKVMRKELKSRNIKKLKVVYSTAETIELKEKIINEESKKVTLGSISFVPSVAGLIAAGEVIKDIINMEK